MRPQNSVEDYGNIRYTIAVVIALAMKSGLLTGDLPFVRLGNAPTTLVIFPGLGDAVWDVRTHAWNLPLHHRRFLREFTLYFVSRKRGLPPGYSPREMAADYARAFEHDIGAAHVLGISLGGYVAQCLAAESPQYVQRLVIGCAAHRVSENGREIPERWLALAREDRWQDLRMDVAKVVVNEYQQTFFQFLIPLLSRRPKDPSDFLVSLEACVAFDGTELLGHIRAPTLVIGGTADTFFPEALLREAAEQIPHASLRLIQGTGHGAYRLHKSDFEGAVIEFLKQ